MKTAQIMRLLQISRPTVTHYREKGYIKATLLPNGQFDYADDTVYQYLNKGVKRRVYLYARVSTPKQKKDLDNQVELLKAWAFSNGILVSGIFSDIASGISFERRKGFFEILDEVMKNRVESVIISYKDRLSRVAFDLFSYMFQRFGTKIVVVSEIGNPKLDSEEVFEEIVSLLHCYSMKLYSKRKRALIQPLVEDGGE